MRAYKRILTVTLGVCLILVSAVAWAQTPADAVADAVADSGVFPEGTSVVSVTVAGDSCVVDLSAEAITPDFGDSLSDSMVKAVVDALGVFEELKTIEVTVGGEPLWTYLPRSDDSFGAMDTFSIASAMVTLSAQDPLVSPSVDSLSSELAGKLVVLGPSHGAYASATSWYRAMRTFCGPNPEPPRPAGWTGSTYQPSNYYYWTKGFQFPSFYEDDMSLEFARFLYAYCKASGADTHVHRNIDLTAGNFDYAAHGYPAPPTSMRPLPKWMVAAKYHLQDRGDVPEWVWNDPTQTTESNKDLRSRPYFANWLMQQGGYDWNDCVYISHHSNAAGVGQARGTEAFWYTSTYPYLQARATAFTTSVLNGALNGIRNHYDGFWGNAMYPVVVPNPPEFPSTSGTYRGYDHAAPSTPSSTAGWQNRGVKTSNFGEIREAKMPATLIEIAFHDDWKFYPDMVFMNDQIWRSAVAWGEYEGVCQHFGVAPRARDAASVASVSFPTLVGPGQAITGTVAMKNEGIAWCYGMKWEMMLYFPYTVWALKATAGDQFGAAGTKIAIANDGIYYPGDTAEFAVSLTAPVTTGLYTTSWRMIKDDARGGSFGEVATAQIQVDADAPVITITSPAAQNYAYGCVTVSFSATDALSEVASLTANIDGVDVVSGQTVCNLALGAHVLTVTAVDTFGNTATESVTFNVVNSVGKVTIGGWIELENKKGTCGFSCEYVEGAASPAGNMAYQDHDTGMRVIADQMIAIGIVGNQAWFYGTCTINGEAGHWFRVDVTDNGEPGSSDVFNITLDTGYSQGGTLGGGNIEIY